MVKKKKIEVELPEAPSAGGYSCCPSGDGEYDAAIAKWHEACNATILKAVPINHKLVSSEVKKTTIVRNFAEIVVESYW
jgi:hypothetical protein